MIDKIIEMMKQVETLELEELMMLSVWVEYNIDKRTVPPSEPVDKISP